MRTEKLDGVVVLPSIFHTISPVAGSSQCEPMPTAPIGSYSGIFASDENGQIIQRTTVGKAGTYAADGSGSCEFRFRLDVPKRQQYRVTAGYIVGAPPSYSVVIDSGETADIRVPAP